MATESFLVTTLPHTADAAASVHLSLFVTHRLTPDGAEGVVADFPRVAEWTSRLSGAHIQILGRAGGGATKLIASTPDFSQLKPDLWPEVFPPKLTVRPWRTPDPASEQWQTFPAHRMQQHALLTHAASVFSSPVGSPSVRGNVLTRFVLGAVGLAQFERSLDVETLLLDDLDIDEIATRYLDEWSGGGAVGEGIGSTTSSAAAQPLQLLTADAHRARRYYQRPEQQDAYRAEPDPNATAIPVGKPTPDFHERASLLGDLSPLLRRLGLVIDVAIDDVSDLDGITEISAVVEVPDLDNPIRTQPRTSCSVSGTAFTATSATGDYDRGLLRLGDEERFRILDLDPDASALKLEQYVRTMPRLLATENNGDPTSSSPPALRATGFSIARVDQADQLQQSLAGAPAKDAALVAGTAAPLNIEDLARGLRLEVWDDVTGGWHSLHRRRLDVEVDGAGQVLADAPDAGFLQGAALTRADDAGGGIAGAPYHAHEVIAGWDGWSLAVPRPGKVVIHDDGDEILKDAPDPDPDPVNPVASVSNIEPLTLPSLRYGRNYSFRAWTVDLAGNSAPHSVAGPPSADDPNDTSIDGDSIGPARKRGRPDYRPDKKARVRMAKTARGVAEARVAELPLDATVARGRPETEGAGAAIRESIVTLHPRSEPGPTSGRGAGGLDLTTFAPTGLEDVDGLIRDRLSRRLERRSLAGPTRRQRVEASFNDVSGTLPRLFERTDAQTPSGVYAEALEAAVLTQHELPPPTAEVLTDLSDLVTPARPFLRWDPIVEPVVVPRHPYTEAESLLTLVIRSGVEGPANELDLTIVDPAAYSAQMLADHPALDLQWRGDSQRHVAPPKTSQYDAELHGMFDAAFGSAGADAVRRALAVALRESGTFLDETVADIATPGARLPQPGIAFHTGPTAETPDAPTPGDLERGAPLTPGQYVVHDTDQVVLPYLPDPLATKVSMTFPDAGSGHHLFGLFAIEGVTLRYRGTWPETQPFRIHLESGDELAARATDGVVRFAVPPGEQLRMNLSSGLDRAGLDLLGLWRSLPALLRSIDVVAEAAADGWFWWLTPPTQVRFVHAVPRPVEVPRPTILLPVRAPGDTAVALVGGVDLHGPSTERLDVEASWSEWVDDITRTKPERVDVKAAASDTTVAYDEDLVVLGREDQTLPLPDGTVLDIHGAVHQLGDTRHRDIDYRMRATTRYREYFDPRVVPTPDDVSVVGPTRRLDVPSSARPAKPVISDVLPLFRWFEETEPAQPFGLRRTRRAGLRIYLERPWYSSGDGELLGVVLAFGKDTDTQDHISLWGGDPVFLQQGPASRSILPLTDIAHLVGLDDRRESGRPVGPPTARTLVDVPGNPAVWILGYEPEFSEDRQKWFADIAIDPGTAIWPFVRFAVTRFQPSSLPGLHLSPVVNCDFVPLPPERTATLSRPDNRHARVIVTGPVGVPQGPSTTTARPSFFQMLQSSRTMRARLERKLADVPSDLGWETVSTTDLPILGIDGTVVSWSAELELARSVPPRRPGTSTTWRVVVEEWEHLPADRSRNARRGGVQSRVVYADHLVL